MPVRKNRLATSEDVAKLAGVSRATVSHVVSRTKYVSPELIERVQAAIKKLNYQRHGVARSLVSRETCSIGVLVPRFSSSFYPPIISAIEKTLGREGYSIILCDSAEDPSEEEDMLRVLAEKRVDGIVWVPCGNENLARVRSLATSGFPVVILDRRLDADDFDAVVSDNEQAGRLAVEHLFLHGYRRISILTFSQKHAPARERLLGYRLAHQEAGVAVDESLVCVAGTPEYQSACELLVPLLSRSSRPQAIFACSDLLTLAALQESRRAGLSVPDDIAIVGFDDSPWAAFVAPPLTVVTQDGGSLGTLAAKMMIRRLRKRTAPRAQTVKVPVILVKRFSCGESMRGRTGNSLAGNP